MATQFERRGIGARAVWGSSTPDERRDALTQLRDGTIQALFTVDLFNEGIDVPTVDTLLLIRPTESATLFLQQLGRGLRRAHGKSLCAVLDFVGLHRREFRFDLKYRALLGGSRRDLERQVEQSFPFLPSGCHMELDPVAQRAVLESVRNAIPTRWPERVAELRSIGDVRLGRFLAESGLELDDVYANGRSWSELRRAAGLSSFDEGPAETSMLRAVGRLLHVDDDERLNRYREFLTNDSTVSAASLSPRDQLRMLIASMVRDPALTSLDAGRAHLLSHRQVCAEMVELLDELDAQVEHVQPMLGTNADVPLHVHARYTRLEIQSAFGDGAKVLPPRWDSGVKWLPYEMTDIFAFTLDKTSGDFSPTTRYRDYAISPDLIHWESQSMTSVASETGQRYLHHAERGSDVVLFARLRANDRAFWCVGPATYVRHEGDRPIAITWRLRYRLPADLYTAFAAAVAG